MAAAHSVTTTSLRDGTTVDVRPLVSSDRDALLSAFDELSATSRYSRFLAPLRELTPAMLDHLVDGVDQTSHVALVLSVNGGAVGVGRFVRDSGDPTRAEIAVTVVDAWQRRGAGAVLVDALVGAAHELGVTTFTAVALATNAATLRLLERTGTVTSRELVGPGVVALEVAVR
ncbi:MAG: N-acetyltransferase family protein [Mycobacteriales bacterium]|nr:GNAT family N-acetyltransferase [Frankia sp.]